MQCDVMEWCRDPFQRQLAGRIRSDACMLSKPRAAIEFEA